MIYGSVCSGIEAASVAWHPLGWRAAFLSEIDAFPRAVLRHHWPDVPLHGDFTTIQAGEYEPIELLVGGTPCQSFSVAGLRGGLADDRGNLALQFLKLADRLRPRWVVWENVPGVLSSNGGRDLGAILGGLVELGYGFAYRVLDAQFFGVPQRRRRVFVVGCFGDWRGAAAVLFERHSLSGHPAPSRQTGARVTQSSLTGRLGGGGPDDNKAQGGFYQVAPPVTHNPYGDHESREGLLVAHSLRADGFDASEDGTGRGTPLVPVQCNGTNVGTDLPSLRAGNGHLTGGSPAIAFDTTQITHPENRSNPQPGDPCGTLAKDGHPPAIAFTCKDHGADVGDLAPTLRGMGHSESHPNGGGQIAVAFQEAQTGCREYDSAGSLRANGPGHDPVGTRIREGMAVRRLTPLECERLQGFPDNYTLVPVKRVSRNRLLSPRHHSYTEINGEVWQLAADGPRYKALGNSMCRNVMEWLGQRIDAVHRLAASEDAA